MNITKQFLNLTSSSPSPASRNQVGSTLSGNALNVRNNNNATYDKKASEDLFAMLGDVETARFKSITRLMLSLVNKTTSLDAEAEYPIRKKFPEIGYVDRAIVRVQKDYVQIGLMMQQPGEVKVLVTHFVSDTLDYKKGTLQITARNHETVNVIANMVRILSKMIVEAGKVHYTPISSVQVRYIQQSHPGAILSQFEPLVKALQRRKLFAEEVTLIDADHHTSRKIKLNGVNVSQTQLLGGKSQRQNKNTKRKFSQ